MRALLVADERWRRDYGQKPNFFQLFATKAVGGERLARAFR
jgi:hypothetical protein